MYRSRSLKKNKESRNESGYGFGKESGYGFGKFSRKREYAYYYLITYMPSPVLRAYFGLSQSELTSVREYLREIYGTPDETQVDVPVLIESMKSLYPVVSRYHNH
jgi:hypothetical protein